MKIFDALKQKPKGEELAYRLTNEIRVRALDKLQHVRDLFPDFTDHAIRHCEGVISVLDWLVPDDIKKQLNEWELYFLIAATYLHDIGMVEGCPGRPEGKDWEEYFLEYKSKSEDTGITNNNVIENSALREYIRDNHHIRSQEYIKDNFIELGLRATDTPAEGSIIARIALGHREVNLADRTQFGEIGFGSNNQLIRRDLLAAYLRLADELDTTALRTPWAEFEVIRKYNEASLIEWAKHLSISGVNADSGIIYISGECRDHSVYIRIDRLKNELQDKLVEIKRMLKRPYVTGDGFNVDDPIPYSNIELKIEHIGYLPIDIKFELQDNEIIKLIMGERLYGDRTACIRELLQNSVDTCKEAIENRPRNWSPEIVVKEEEDSNTITVTDNGMGMDEYIVRQYFSRIGISYYSSHDFKGRFKPISEFGIGILSCFMIADYIEVDSLREGKEPIRLVIRSLTESFVPSKGSREEPGTTIKIHLKPECRGEFNIFKIVRRHLKYAEFPIKIINSKGLSEELTFGKLVPEYDDLIENIDDRYRESFSRVWKTVDLDKNSAEKRSQGINIGVTLLDECFPKNWMREPKHGDDVIYLGHGSSRGKIYQEGFYVGDFPYSFRGIGNWTWCEVNVTGKNRFSLTVDRSRIAEDDNKIWSKIVELHSELVEKICKRESKTWLPEDWWRYHLIHYPKRIKIIPKALRNAVFDTDFCTFTKDGFKNRKLDEIHKWKGNLYYINGESHNELERIRNLISGDSLIIVVPYRMYYWDFEGDIYPWWYSVMVEAKDIKSAYELCNDLGIKHHRYKIDEKTRVFVDTGYCLNKWKFDTQWMMGRNNVNVFDYNDPFSKIIIEWCKKQLPRGSHQTLAEIFRTEYRLPKDILKGKQLEAIEIFKKEGVIPESVKFTPSRYIAYKHECSATIEYIY
jgi:hypothetical protein